MNMAAKTDIVQNRHAAENFNFLESSGNSQFRPVMGLQSVDFFSLIINIPFLRMVKTADTVHHNCFAGTVWPYNRMYFAFFDFGAYAAQSAYLAEKHLNFFEFQNDFTWLD